MNDLLNKTLLLGISSVLAFNFYDKDAAIVYLLVSIILTCIMSSTEQRHILAAVFVLFLFLCMIKPVLLIYLPAILYDMFTPEQRSSILLALIPLTINASFYQKKDFLLFLFCVSFAMLLKNQSVKYEALKKEYNALRDDTKELELKLEKQNQSLVENQDIQITAAMLSERNRISKEIHDNIGHLLSRSLLQIGALLTISKDDITKETLTALRDSISNGMDSIRNSIHNMHDESIDLHNACSTLINEFRFCQISLEYDIHLEPDTKIKNAFINILKEALNNIIKHSNATNVTVRVLEQPAMYQLIISDNGVLSPTDKWKISHQEFEGGMGLSSMFDRVKQLQGNFNIITDHGFEIFISITKSGGTPL